MKFLNIVRYAWMLWSAVFLIGIAFFLFVLHKMPSEVYLNIGVAGVGVFGIICTGYWCQEVRKYLKESEFEK